MREKQGQPADARSLLERIINSISEPIFVKDRQHRRVLVNDAYCRFSGRSREREIGSSDHDYFPKPEADAFRLKEEEVFNSGEESISEEKFTAAHGDVRTIITKRSLYTDEKGEAFIVGVVQDITGRAQTEDALRESQALYHSLVDQMPAGMYRKNRKGQFVFVNSWFCELKRMKLDQILGRTASEIAAREVKNPTAKWRTELADTANAQHELIMQTAEKMESEEEYFDEAGKTQYLRAVRSPVYDSGGNITGTQGMLFDITASKEAEAELDYERELLRSLLDNLPDSIYFKDLQSRLVNVSRYEAENLFKNDLTRYRAKHPGESEEQLPPHLTSLEQFRKYAIGKTDADFYGNENASVFGQDELEIIRTGQPIIGKMEHTVRSDGSSIWYMTTKVPWRNKKGEIIGTFGTSRNVSALKEAEAKIEETHKKLLETSRQAGMAEIATNVLHNVGNVLNSVNVSANVVADGVRRSKVSSLAKVAALLAEHEHDLGAFFGSDSRGKQLPEYLSKLSKHFIEQQRATVEELDSLRGNIDHIKVIVAMQQRYANVSGVKEVVNIRDLVEDSLRMNIDALGHHGVEIIREFADVPPFSIDKHRVLQILVNLLRNAKHACQDSNRTDKRLTVRLTNAGDRVRVSVNDNGIGIPPENLTRIFNHGFTTKKDGHGFGLHSGSLAATELGGSLTVHSDGTGCGATFTLELPVPAKTASPESGAL
ncbi:MAG: PAS domain-containing sensor histidine kinase [Burkholderiaceae bacterium]